MPKAEQLQDTQIEQGVNDIQPIGDVEEKDYMPRIKANLQKAEPYMSELMATAKQNKDQYLGRLITDSDIEASDELISDNLTFISVETIVPIATRKTPIPNVELFPRKQSSVPIKNRLENYLKDLWEVEIQMSRLTERALRGQMFEKFFCFKYLYNTKKERYDSYRVSLKRLVFPKVEDWDDLTFVGEKVDMTLGEVKEKFPDKYKELKRVLESEHSNVSDDTKFTAMEYWEPNRVVWFYKDTQLGVKDNPNYDFEDEDNNHFTEPRLPYVFFSVLTSGDEAADETSLIEQARTPQRSVNLRKIQIDRNIREMDSVWETYNVTESQGNALMEGGTKVVNHTTPDGFVRKVASNAITEPQLRDLQHTELLIDKIFGTLATIRGEQDTAETATGRSILRESALTRLELIHKNLEYFAQQWYNAAVQIIKLFYDEPVEVYTTPEDVNPYEEDYTINSEMLRGKRVQVLVQAGSTVPKDKAVIRAEAFDLFTAGAISRKDLHIALGNDNPERLARNAFLEQNQPDLLYDELMGNEYDAEAITHIYDIINSRQVMQTETQDLEALLKHVETHIKYMEGIEVHEDLPDYGDLPFGIQTRLKEHTRIENETLIAMQAIQTQQQVPDTMQSPEQAVVPADSTPSIDQAAIL